MWKNRFGVLAPLTLSLLALGPVGCLAQSPAAGPATLADPQREFVIRNQYLNLPIQNGAPKRKVTVLVDGQEAVKLDIELAGGAADWWAPMDVRSWRGNKVVLLVDQLPADSAALKNIEPSDEIKDAEHLYHEPLRPQFHFSPRRGWNNDPNGLVFYRGEYHLFFQHNPYGWGWGNMHWGHATSRDLVHWREQGDVLAPDQFGPMYSGSAVVDWQNTSGLGSAGQPAQVLVYTACGHPAVQCLAYSTDGRNYTKFSGNPVLKQITEGNRDPKVRWYAPERKWIMVLYAGFEDPSKPDAQGRRGRRDTIQFLSSTNLKDWTVMSEMEGFFECPDFFPLPDVDDPAKVKWVLTAASSDYMIGAFNGAKFTPETPKLKGQRGRGFYAAQTFSDIPTRDGRRIQIGWFQTETRGMPFNQCLTIPLSLSLRSTPAGPRLNWQPVKELEALRGKSRHCGAFTLQPGGANPLADTKGELLEVRADFEPGSNTGVSFAVRGMPISYDAGKEELTVNGLTTPAPLLKGRQRIIIYADRTSLEIFASDGLVYVPMPVMLQPENQSVEVSMHGSPVRFEHLDACQLKSIW